MPCYEISTVAMEFAVADVNLLADALVATDFASRSNALALAEEIKRTGKIKVRAGNESRITRLKRAYAEGAVRKAAKKNRWQIKQTKRGLVMRKG